MPRRREGLRPKPVYGTLGDYLAETVDGVRVYMIVSLLTHRGEEDGVASCLRYINYHRPLFECVANNCAILTKMRV